VQTATISVAHGTLTALGSGAGLTSITGGGTSTITIVGSTAAVDVALNAGVSYTPTANFNGSDTLTITDHDAASASATQQQVAITVTAVNDPPTATNLSAAETYTQNTSLNLVNIVASDIDSANVTATLTLSNTAAGSLSTAT